jgi:hypothetical protein
MANLQAQQQGQGQGQGGVGYSAPPTSNPYQSAFSSQQSPITSQQLTPFAQQIMQRSMAPNPILQEAMGLQAALAQMGAQFNQPMMRSQFTSMPTYQNPALSYRPSLASAQQNLNRVAPSVELQQRQAAEAAAAEAARLKRESRSGWYRGDPNDDAAYEQWERQQTLGSINSGGS